MSLIFPYLLVSVRLSGMMVAAPVFHLKQLPNLAKAGLVLLLSLLITPLVAPPPTPPGVFAVALAVGWEFAVGWLVGSLTSLASSIALSAGGILDVQLGLANATLLNPGAGEAHPLLSNLYQTTMMLLLLAGNAHYALIVLVLKSYQWFPSQGHWQLALLTRVCSGCFHSFFPLLLAVVLPVMTAMLGVELFLAFLGRLLPQVNILIIGAPIRLILGWLLLLAALPVTLSAFDDIWQSLLSQLG